MGRPVLLCPFKISLVSRSFRPVSLFDLRIVGGSTQPSANCTFIPMVKVSTCNARVSGYESAVIHILAMT